MLKVIAKQISAVKHAFFCIFKYEKRASDFSEAHIICSSVKIKLTVFMKTTFHFSKK